MGVREIFKMNGNTKSDIRELLKSKEQNEEQKRFDNPIHSSVINPAQAMSLEAKAHGLMSRGDFGKAELLFIQAAENYEKNDQRRARCFRNIALINEKLERPTLAIEYYSFAAKIYGVGSPNASRCLNQVDELKSQI